MNHTITSLGRVLRPGHAERRAVPTVSIAGARRHAASVRLMLALTGVGLLIADPGMHPFPVLTGIGFALMGLIGVLRRMTWQEPWLRLDEGLTCFAAVTIVGLGDGRVTPLTIVWLAAVAAGVLARGGRVGQLGRLVVLAALITPLVAGTGRTIGSVAIAVAALGMLHAIGRASTETSALLRDPLTGVLSRAAFHAHVDRLLGHADGRSTPAVIMLDLDDFGVINKTFGHAEGDRQLVRAARAIRATLREGDVLGRVGGDEFAALVFGSAPERVADRIIQALGGTHGGADQQPETAACAGIACWPRDGRDAETLLDAADLAMRIAKRDGGGRASLYAGRPMDEGPGGARAIIERLCRGEGISMVVQPIVDLRTGGVHAYEALARFKDVGSDSPAHWLTRAEMLGSRPALEIACLQAGVALLDTLPGHADLHLNVSARLLGDARVLELFEGCGEPRRVVIEITEEKLVACHAAVDEGIERLRARGLRFAVDDVGAGYAGLGQVAVLRPSLLKLDRALARGIDQDPARGRFVHALSEYARATGCLLVAEGIETPAELDVVRRIGVPLVQGYLTGRPGWPWPQASPAGEELHLAA